MVERAHALHRPVGELHGESPVALVEPLGERPEGAIRIGVFFENPPDDLVGDAAGAYLRPRRYSSALILFPPSR